MTTPPPSDGASTPPLSQVPPPTMKPTGFPAEDAVGLVRPADPDRRGREARADGLHPADDVGWAGRAGRPAGRIGAGASAGDRRGDAAPGDPLPVRGGDDGGPVGGGG